MRLLWHMGTVSAQIEDRKINYNSTDLTNTNVCTFDSRLLKVQYTHTQTQFLLATNVCQASIATESL